MKTRTLFLFLALALVGPAHAAATITEVSVVRPGPESGGWVAKAEDNICGITSLKRVSKPAKVDYEEVLDATPQMKKIKREGIDPDSVEGKALRKAARTLITKTCQAVRKARAHCSVWKAISHRDGRKVPDVTEAVIDRF